MNPVIVEVCRGALVESRHTGAWVVVDADGRVAASGGHIERAVFPRSSIKALQALPLLLAGAADRAGFTDAELALACASHDGWPVHADTARAMLEKLGLAADALECGTHWPTSRTAASQLAASGAQPSALHNNCSGKHAGFLALARALQADPPGYVLPDHPAMQRVTAVLEHATGLALGPANRAVDGCAIPAYTMPLTALATAFARFGTGLHWPADFAAAAARLRRAVAAHPVMVAGEGRFDTEIAAALGEAAFVKIGAEGVQCGALPGLGLGFAIKCDDGALRASEAAAASLLRRWLGPDPLLERLAAPVLRNWNGTPVGAVRGLIG